MLPLLLIAEIHAAELDEGHDIYQRDTAAQSLSIDATKIGAEFDVVLIGNTSRVSAFLGVESGAISKLDAYRSELALPKDFFHARFPNFRSIRIGNLFFGYKCSGENFQEVAIRGTDGRLIYQFEETIRFVEALLHGGMKPSFALTGIPKVMVPVGEEPIAHPAYGCVNAPELDWTKSSPKERTRDWWQLQNAFMMALIDRFGIDEVRSWEFATWTEPPNPVGNVLPNLERNNNAHLRLPKSVIIAGRQYEAVASIIAASIDVAMLYGIPIHIGNFAGAVDQTYPKIINEIKRFPKGEAYLKYISGYAISRYRVKPAQDIGRMLDRAFNLLIDPAMPDKPLYIDEFGELAGDDGVMPHASTLEGANFVGTLLVRVFNRQDGTARVPKRIAFWNNYITPRPNAVLTKFDDYLKTPSTNVVNMFASLNGYKKLYTSGDSNNAVAGMKNGILKIVLLANRPKNGKGEPSSAYEVASVNSIELHGLKPNTSYRVISSTIDQNSGNPLSVFLGGTSDYRLDPQHRFISDGKKWKLSSSYWRKCFYDEIKECAWRERAQKVDSPILQLKQGKTDTNGMLRIALDLNSIVAVMLDVEEAVEVHDLEPLSMVLDFNSGTELLMHARLKAMQNISFDAGVTEINEPIRNDERNQALRFHENARFVLAHSPSNSRVGRIRFRFKVDGDALEKDMILIEWGVVANEGLRVAMRKGGLNVELKLGSDIRVSTPQKYIIPKAWNALELAFQSNKLYVKVNGKITGIVDIPHGFPSASQTGRYIFVGTSSNFTDVFNGVIDDLQFEGDNAITQ